MMITAVHSVGVNQPYSPQRLLVQQPRSGRDDGVQFSANSRVINALKKTQYLSPMAFLVGSLLLLGGHAVKPVLNLWHLVRQTDRAESEEDKRVADALAEVLRKMGWASLATGALASVPVDIISGIKAKQPSWVLGGALSAIPSTVLYFDQSVPVVTALYLCLGLMLSGFANKIANKHGPNNKSNPNIRAFDLKQLQGLFKGQVDKAVLRDLAQFIKQDQIQVFQMPQTVLKQFKKDGVKATIKSTLLLPSPEQSQFSSLLIYLGGLPLLLLGSGNTVIALVLQRVQGAGVAAGYASLLPEAIASRNTPQGKILLSSIIVRTLGKLVFGLSEPGVALEKLSQAGSAYYFIQDQAVDDKVTTEHLDKARINVHQVPFKNPKLAEDFKRVVRTWPVNATQHLGGVWLAHFKKVSDNMVFVSAQYRNIISNYGPCYYTYYEGYFDLTTGCWQSKVKERPNIAKWEKPGERDRYTWPDPQQFLEDEIIAPNLKILENYIAPEPEQLAMRA